MPEKASPMGPIFGSDTVVVEVEDYSGGVHVRPDACNVALRAAGLPARYYFQPTRVPLVPRQGSPDVDFSASVLVKGAPGSLEYVGGSCTFTVTLTLPDPVLAAVVQKLAHQDHSDPAARIAELFEHRAKEPTPVLAPVQVNRSALSCLIQQPGAGKEPLVMTAQHGAAGSVEGQGRNTFLVSFSPAAAEAVVRNLRDGAAPPFLIRNHLTEQFTTGSAELTVRISVDVDKLYEVLAEAGAPGGPLPEDATLDAGYMSALASGAVTTQITDVRGGLLDSGTEIWTNGTDEIKTAVFSLVKDELFDLGAGPGAITGLSWREAVFGDHTATLRRDRPRTGMALSMVVTLHGTVSAVRTAEGNLQELVSAAKADLDKYLIVVDAGAF